MEQAQGVWVVRAETSGDDGSFPVEFMNDKDLASFWSMWKSSINVSSCYPNSSYVGHVLSVSANLEIQSSGADGMGKNGP